jgi:hypothetical protein
MAQQEGADLVSEDVPRHRPERKNGASRRAALKAGVGVGVGLAAWSGPTITSLGGTPAYAAGCTFAVFFDLSGGCRNVDNSAGCDFRYHSLVLAGLPPGYSIAPNIPEGTCCGTFTSTLTFPAGMECQVTITFFRTAVADPQGGCTGLTVSLRYPPTGPSASPVAINYGCLPFDPATNTVYTIVLACNTAGAPPECLG